MNSYNNPDSMVAELNNPEPAPRHTHRSLRESVQLALAAYFEDLDGQHTTELYQLVLQEVEAPLLEAVLAYTGNNQCRAAEMLGLNRGTLRKKLKYYNLL